MNDDSEILFSEVQHFSRFFFWGLLLIVLPISALIIIFVLPVQLQGAPNAGTLRLIIAAALILADLTSAALLLSTRLITEVRRDGLFVKYFPFPFHWSFHRISLDAVRSIEAVTYRPLIQYGGWGIRFGWKGRAYNARGNRGVRIEYLNGRHMLIGSQEPEKLADSIKAIR
jgi:hypothetical protein